MDQKQPLAEDVLAVQAADGDLHAFEQLAASWNRRIYNFALRYLGDHHEAQEASQQTFIKAYQRIGSLRNGTQFQAWIYVIAGNTCRDALRRNARSHTEPLDARSEQLQAEAQHTQPGSRLARQDMTRMLKQAMAQLPDEQRLVLILKEYEGLKFSEIAHILNEQESTIKSRLYAGMKTMRKLLNNYKQEDE